MHAAAWWSGTRSARRRSAGQIVWAGRPGTRVVSRDWHVGDARCESWARPVTRALRGGVGGYCERG